MIELQALAYASTATRPLSGAELDRLLVSARDFNASVGVTGALFHHDGRFFQYIEGPSPGLLQAYARVIASRLHKGLIELASGPIGRRHFETWHMGFCEPPASALQRLASDAWEEAMPITRDAFENPRHMGMVLECWNRWSAEAMQPKQNR